jgi:hypothetical protein
LRQAVRNFYDLQRMRLQTAGRVQKKAPGAEIQLSEHDIARFKIRAMELETLEKHQLDDVEDFLKDMPFYVNTLSDKDRFKGIGPTMAGVILSEFDIARADTVSKMWAFSGLAPIAARRCMECERVALLDEENSVHDPDDATNPKGLVYVHAKGSKWVKGAEVKCSWDGKRIPHAYTRDSGKAMKPVRGEKLTYNSFLRSKLCGVLGPILIKCDSPWRKHYDDYKKRWISQNRGVNDAHRHAAAIRYMIKMLLIEIYKEWRAAEGLPVRPPYAEEKLGHTHVGGTTKNNQEPNASDLTPEQEEELKIALG